MRLRLKIGRALAIEPRGLARSIARYVSLRRTIPRMLASDGLDHVLARLDEAPPRSPLSVAVLATAIEVGDALLHARRGHDTPHDTCLYRALARYALLSEHGAGPTFVVGIDAHRVRDASDSIGHAWVEVEGETTPYEPSAALVESLRHHPSRRLDRSPSP